MLKYETPKAEIIAFRMEDILTASPDWTGDFTGSDDGDDRAAPGESFMSSFFHSPSR